MKTLFKMCALAVFLMATLFYNIRFSYLVVYHSANNESFTELYCENKDKPEMECNGQCELSKAFAETNSESNPLALQNFQRDITLFCNPSVSEELILSKTIYIPVFFYQNQYSFLFTKPIPHPPAGLS
ncbi:MAG: hypothetical protein R6U03_08510 [Gillisia sp.]